jgi:hypothetical protein
VDRVAYVDELAAVLISDAPPCLHVLSGTNTDSGSAVAPPPKPEGLEAVEYETAGLFPAITEVRAVFDALAAAHTCSSRAQRSHVRVARTAVRSPCAPADAGTRWSIARLGSRLSAQSATASVAAAGKAERRCAGLNRL